MYAGMDRACWIEYAENNGEMKGEQKKGNLLAGKMRP
jgi:hypothetical protein